MRIEGFFAIWYARLTGVDRRRFVRAAHAVSERVARGGRVLELAPGPGYLAIELAALGYRVVGLDISRSFLRIARDNASAANVAVDFARGDAAHLPFADASFDHVVCMAAFESFADPVGALAEIHRVLVPGASASIYELRRDVPRDPGVREPPSRYRSSELVVAGMGFELRHL